jgi:hypothetical protein
MKQILVLLLAILSAFCCAGEPDSLQLQDFENGAAITPNQDGGQAPTFSLDEKNVRTGKNGLRIVYKNDAQGYGNLSLPAKGLYLADAVTLQIFKESAAPKAAMHLWLFEEDGDAWLSTPIVLEKLQAGWNVVRIPITDFRHEKRGDGKPDLPHVTHMLLGCNFADFTVVVDDLRLEGQDIVAKSAAQERAGKMIVIREEQPVVTSFFGFGAEWDPKFWTSGTFKTAGDAKTESTVTEQDWELVQKRIRWMRLPFVRMMMCSRWCTNGDGTFDWQNKHMQSLYRHLDVCQKENITVLLTDWGCVPDWLKVPGYNGVDDPKYAEGIGTYLDYLIREKKYTCIKYFILVNEPNFEAGGYDHWKKGVQNVAGVMKVKKLDSQITFMGSDHSGGDDWHRNAVDQLSSILGAYDIHRYAPEAEVRSRQLERYWRTQWKYALDRDPQAKTKVMIVGEAGLHSAGFSASQNPFHLNPEYATHMADYAVQATNAGSWGVSAWMLDDTSHEGFTWGMWKNKSGGFALKPWFYTWSLLSRLFPRQSRIATVDCANVDLRIMAARLPKESGGGWSFCIVNRGPAGAVTLRVPESPPVKLSRYVYESKQPPKVDADGFPAPVESVDLDLGKGAEVAVPADGVVFLTTIGTE